MKKIAIVSAKGGVGKSTISANLAMALFSTGLPTLGVDLDPQNALHLHFGGQNDTIEGLSRATLEGRDWRETAHQVDGGLAILPYGIVNESDRQQFEALLATDHDWLQRSLDSLPLSPDTMVVIDTPPGPSVYLQQALSAAQLVIVVTLADAASYATLPQMEKLIRAFCLQRDDFINYAYLVNQFDVNRTLCNDVVEAMREQLPGKTIGLVQFDPSVGEALAWGKTLIERSPESLACKDFMSWTSWILKQASPELSPA